MSTHVLDIVTTGDDIIIKIWDCISKCGIQTLEGCTLSVSFVVYYPLLLIIRLWFHQDLAHEYEEHIQLRAVVRP